MVYEFLIVARGRVWKVGGTALQLASGCQARAGTTPFQLHELPLILLNLLLNVLLVVLYVNQLIPHLAHYQPAAVIQGRRRAHSGQYWLLLPHRGWIFTLE